MCNDLPGHLGIGDMGHQDAGRAAVQRMQDVRGAAARHADQAGDTDGVGSPQEVLQCFQPGRPVLHVDDDEVEAGPADHLDHRWAGLADEAAVQRAGLPQPLFERRHAPLHCRIVRPVS